MRAPQYITLGRDAHWYTKDGKARHDVDLRVARKEMLYTSVSTVLSEEKSHALDIYNRNQVIHACLTTPQLEHEIISEYAKRIDRVAKQHSRSAADFGTGMHKAIELYEAGRFTEIGARYQPYMVYYEQWREMEIAQLIETETVLVDHDIWVAGRGDMIYNDVLMDVVFTDFKTTEIEDGEKVMWRRNWLKQLAGYLNIYARSRNLLTRPRAKSVVINSLRPEPFHVREWTQDELGYAWEAFKKQVWVWYFNRDYWPGGKPDLPIEI